MILLHEPGRKNSVITTNYRCNMELFHTYFNKVISLTEALKQLQDNSGRLFGEASK